MKKIITGKAVTLVTLPEYLDVLQTPQIGDYSNPRIVKLTPCEKKNDKLFDLRTGRQVEKPKRYLEWVNLSGTVFKYPDGRNILLTKVFATNTLMCVDVASSEIRETTMIPRRVFERIKETS